MKPLYLMPAIGLAMTLAACGEKGETNAPAPANTAAGASGSVAGMDNMSDDMGNMAMPAAKTAKATGTIKAIDKTAGTITLDHGPIAEASWPAMTMAFKAGPAILDAAQVGERVDFDLKLTGAAGEVTAIRKRP